ncbi:MAG: hypothetical protein OXN90_13735 [Gemmatimonadota bacterium]|nr:hypothetical protein [Gemmatimonadota bacterium]
MPEININASEWDDMVREHLNAPHHGAEFLTWHSEFILRFHALLKRVPDQQRPKPADIAAWPAVPQDLKGVGGWDPEWEPLEARLRTNIKSFDSLEDLVEEIYQLHNFLHTAAARFYSDKFVGDRRTAPRSTYFWQIHGLVELWHLDWRRALITA